jgi:hypothetical protein
MLDRLVKWKSVSKSGEGDSDRILVIASGYSRTSSLKAVNRQQPLFTKRIVEMHKR